jgi:hypothetical protein
MLLSSFFTKSRFPITAKIQALIEKVKDREISQEFQEDFLKRIEYLHQTNLFGVYDFDTPDDSTNLWSSVPPYEPYKYATLEFAQKFPEFERLFVEIWILMNSEKVQPSYDRNNIFEYYYYQHRTTSVQITIDDSVKIEIPNRDFDINRLEMTINVDSVNLVISEVFYTI